MLNKCSLKIFTQVFFASYMIVWSSLVLISYFGLSFYHKLSHRVLDPSRISKNAQFYPIYNFIEQHQHIRPDIIFLGDSQVAGKFVTYDKTFPHLIGMQTNQKIWNLGLSQGYLKDQWNILRILQKQNIRAGTLVMNANAMYAGISNVVRLKDTDNIKRSFFEHILKSPYSIIRSLQSELRSHLPKHIIQKPPKNFPNSFGPGEHQDYFNGVKGLIEKALTLSNKVVMYVSPFCGQVLKNGGIELKQVVLGFNSSIRKICTAMKVECLEPQKEFSCADFTDSVHFRPSGHRKIAHILVQAIRYQQGLTK